ncbi:MAG: hypothetical protein WD851_15370 [Pirellulales bacterium]
MTAHERAGGFSRVPIDLIVCSSAPRWTAAVRTALLAATPKLPQLVFRLHEVEELAQVSRVLELTPRALVGLEVGEENLRGCLKWLTWARRQLVPVVGLLSIAPSPGDVNAAEHHRQRTETLAALVREAGAVWTLASPLQAADLLEIAARHGQQLTATPLSNHALSTEIWRSLPWQSARGPLRLTGDA